MAAYNPCKSITGEPVKDGFSRFGKPCLRGTVYAFPRSLICVIVILSVRLSHCMGLCMVRGCNVEFGWLAAINVSLIVE